MNVEIAFKSGREETRKLACDIAGRLRGWGATAWMEGEAPPGEGVKPDVIVVLGGDGTILRAARQYAAQNLPLLGVNLGQLGFLAELNVGDLDEYLPRLLDGKYTVRDRLMLQVSVKPAGGTPVVHLGLNDAVLRAETARVVEMLLRIDGGEMGVVRGDGFIVATPTGSTGYSLAAGGSIVWPEMEALLLTPINSFSLSSRPLVVPADMTVELEITGKRNVGLTIDGQIETSLFPGDVIEVKHADVKVRMIRMKDRTWAEVLDARLRR